jgi:hypothetical protein
VDKVSKEELFGFLACLLFVPFKDDVTELKLENENWYECFARLAKKMPEPTKLMLLSVIERRVNDEARQKTRDVWAQKEADAKNDSKNASRTPEEGWKPKSKKRREDLKGMQNRIDELVKQYNQLEKRTETIRRLQNSEGEWRMQNARLDARMENCWDNRRENDYKSENIEKVLEESLEQIETAEAAVYSCYVRKPGIIELDFYKKRDHLKDVIAKNMSLNTSQKLAFSVICAHLDACDEVHRPDGKYKNFNIKTSFRCLLAGEGGTGKSRAIHAISEYARRIGRADMVVRAAMFGSIAAAMDGVTIASLLGQKYDGEIDQDDVHIKVISNCSLLILDESSLIDKNTWVNLNEAFQKHKNNKQFLGGVHLLIVGDCFQLPPVSYGSFGMIHQQLAKKNWRSKNTTAKRFSEVTEAFLKNVDHAFILTEQIRMQSCEELIELARAFRRGHFEERHAEFLNSRYKRLEQVDLSNSIVLVSTREEMAAWLEASLELKVKTYGEFCIGWFADWKIPLKDFQSDEERLNFMMNLNKECIRENEQISPISIFVKGELVNCRFNHSVRGGVTNGTFGKLKRFVFPTDTEYRPFNFRGTNITLASNPPLYAEIETIHEGKELPAPFGKKIRPVWRLSRRIGGLNVDATNIPLESASVSTVHGIQGKTIPEEYCIVVTNLRASWSGFPAAGFYVAFTRTRQPEQLIVLKKYTVEELNNLVTNKKDQTVQFREATSESIAEYNRLWDYFEDTWGEIVGSDESFPARLDEPYRLGDTKKEFIGLPDFGNTSWLNASLQLLMCVEDVVKTEVHSNFHQSCLEFFNQLIDFRKSKGNDRLDHSLLKSIVHNSGLIGTPQEFFSENQNVFNIGGHEKKMLLCCQRCNTSSFESSDSFELFNLVPSKEQEDLQELINDTLDLTDQSRVAACDCGSPLVRSFSWNFQKHVLINSPPGENLCIEPQEKIRLPDEAGINRIYKLRGMVYRHKAGRYYCWMEKKASYYLIKNEKVSTPVGKLRIADLKRSPNLSRPSLLLYEKMPVYL